MNDPFIWRAADGTRHTPATMTTTHLFWSLRMVWNHTMPAARAFEPYRRWSDVATWPTETRREAADAFARELARRKPDDLTVEQRGELETMRRGMGAFNAELNRQAAAESVMPEDDPAIDWDDMHHEH